MKTVIGTSLAFAAVLGVALTSVVPASAASAASGASVAQARCGSAYLPGYSVALKDAKGVVRGDLNVLHGHEDDSDLSRRLCAVVTSRTENNFKATLKVTKESGTVVINKAGARANTFTNYTNHSFGYDLKFVATVDAVGTSPKASGNLWAYNSD